MISCDIIVFVFVWLTSLSTIISRSIHVAANGIIYSFYGWIVFCCIYVLHLLYPFICRWTFRFPCLGYCKQYCYEHRGTCVFLNYSFVRIYVQEGDCWIVLNCVRFWETCILFSLVAAPIYITTNSVRGFPFLYTLF